MENQFKEVGATDCNTRYLGGRGGLLSARGSKRIEDIVAQSKDELSRWFTGLRSWVSTNVDEVTFPIQVIVEGSWVGGTEILSSFTKWQPESSDSRSCIEESLPGKSSSKKPIMVDLGDKKRQWLLRIGSFGFRVWDGQYRWKNWALSYGPWDRQLWLSRPAIQTFSERLGRNEGLGYSVEVAKAQCKKVVDNIKVNCRLSNSPSTGKNSTPTREVLEEFQFDEESNTMKLPERWVSSDFVLPQREKRRQGLARRRSLEEILQSSRQVKIKGPKSSRASWEKIHTKAKSLSKGSNSGMDLTDSQILNTNRILCEQEGKSTENKGLFPKNIWGFISRLGMEGSSHEEAILQKLQHMKERDLRQFLDLEETPKDVQA
ncbi:hypothetical protein Ancab_000082 [Ancistrocladus abbreviatus]